MKKHKQTFTGAMQLAISLLVKGMTCNITVRGYCQIQEALILS